MRRPSSEKDEERPRFYSKFWLDIAAGRRVIGESQPEEAEETELAPLSSSGRKSVADRHAGARATAVVAPLGEEEENDEVGEPEEEELTQEEGVEEGELPHAGLERGLRRSGSVR